MRRSFVGRRRLQGGVPLRLRSKLADVLLAAAILVLIALATGRLERFSTINPIGSARVADGDSLELAGQRIRLRGIDAPELAQTCRRSGVEYDCGAQARDALRELIAGRDVSCEGWERDRYGRLLGICIAGPIELNRELVASGWAIAYGDYQAEERSARAGPRGLWAGEFEPPHEWRANHGALAESPHDVFGALINWVRQMFASPAKAI